MSPSASDDEPHALRHRAEERQQTGAARPLTIRPGTMEQLVQELQIHQVELEIQNEELLLAHTAAEISRTQYVDLYNSAPVGYCTLDWQFTLRRVNSCTCRLLGWPANQLLGRSLGVFAEPADVGRLHDLLRQLRATPGRHHSAELTLRRADNQLRRVQVEGVYLEGSPELEREGGFNLALFDVSARHAATQALATSEARFRATFEQSRDGMLLLEDHHFADANLAALRLLGLQHLDQLLGRSLSEFWPDVQPDGQSTLELFNRCTHNAEVRGWCRLELLRRTPVGDLVWDELSFNPVMLKGQALLHAAWRDITVRKRVEEQLRESEARLRQALAAADTGVWSLDLATGTVQLDARAQEVFGINTSLPFALLKAALHPDDLPNVEQALDAAARTRLSFDVEHRLLRPGGLVRYVAATGSFDYDAETGQPQRLHALVRDITARRLTEDELNYKNRLLHNLLRSVPVLLARLGPDGRFREHAGPPLRRMGLADNELVGRLAAEEFPSSARYFERLLAGEPVSYTTAIERQGQTIHLQVFGFFEAERQEAVLFGTDITEAEHLKEEATRLRLRQQQELHAVIMTTQEEERRRIAESLHNGVGQLLYATRLHLDTLPPSENQHTSQELLNEAIRAIRTVSFELTPPVLNDFGLPAALRELFKRIPASHLSIDLHLAGLELPLPAPLQTAVYRMVQELLNNVIKHAQAQEVFISLVRETNQLYLSVEDNGQGLDPDRVADSAGIGLVGIRTRVNLLGGTFEVKSRPGKGTAAFVQLPVAPPA